MPAPSRGPNSGRGKRNPERTVRRPSDMTLLARRRPAVPGRLGAFAPLALGAVAAVALCACAVATAPTAPSGASKPIGSTGVPLTTAKQPAQPAPAPRQRAVADANAIFASFVVPKGARRLSAAPTVEKGVLETPDELPETPDVLDKAGWWIVPGAPPSVLAWEARHLPHRFSASGTGTGSGPGFMMWNQSESLPDVPGVLDSRGLVLTAVPDGHETAIRVDAEVTWQPARPASEKVPAAAKAVTITTDPTLNEGGRKPQKPVTITDPAKVRALTALINDLTLFPPGAFDCPADFDGNLVLTFRAGPRAPALAVATVDLSGCDGVDLTIGGKPQPTLAGPGTDSGPQILRLAGLSWKIPLA
jgi:hypothetical protein